MKKAINKLTALVLAAATAACMSFTVAAASTNTACVPHTTFKHFDRMTKSQSTHDHLYEIRLDENGRATNIYKKCTITLTTYYWKYVCSKCGTVTTTEKSYETIHSVN